MKKSDTYEVTLRRDVQQVTRVRVQAASRQDAINAAESVTDVDHHPDQAEKLIGFLNEKEQFHLSRFDSKRRTSLHGKIREHVTVQPKDVLASIDLHLDNIAIRSEIQTAKETYERAKMFLSGINARTNRLAIGTKEAEAERT